MKIPLLFEFSTENCQCSILAGCLEYIVDFTTQVYGDNNNHYNDPYQTTSKMESKCFFLFFVAWMDIQLSIRQWFVDWLMLVV